MRAPVSAPAISAGSGQGRKRSIPRHLRMAAGRFTFASNAAARQGPTKEVGLAVCTLVAPCTKPSLQKPVGIK